MTSPQKSRYEIKYVDPIILKAELKKFVDSGEFPSSDYQKERHVITRESFKDLVIRYFRRNYFRRN